MTANGSIIMSGGIDLHAPQAGLQSPLHNRSLCMGVICEGRRTLLNGASIYAFLIIFVEGLLAGYDLSCPILLLSAWCWTFNPMLVLCRYTGCQCQDGGMHDLCAACQSESDSGHLLSHLHSHASACMTC
jgi:hypothetical protein